MAIMKIGPAAIISAVALAGVGAAATWFARDGGAPEKTETSVAENQTATPAARSDENADVTVAVADEAEVANGDTYAPEAPAAAPAESLDFAIGSIDDLRKDQLTALVAKIEEVEGVADETKVWVATADVASAPGVETFYHIKGPLTCGRIGCDLIVVSASKAILLETIGEGVSSPNIDTLIINQGTGSAVTWVFDGSRFAERR